MWIVKELEPLMSSIWVKTRTIDVWWSFDLNLCFQENSLFKHIWTKLRLIKWKMQTINLVKSLTWTTFGVDANWIIVFVSESWLNFSVGDIKTSVFKILGEDSDIKEYISNFNYYLSWTCRFFKRKIKKII